MPRQTKIVIDLRERSGFFTLGKKSAGVPALLEARVWSGLRTADITLLIFIASYFYARLLIHLRGRAKP